MPCMLCDCEPECENFQRDYPRVYPSKAYWCTCVESESMCERKYHQRRFGVCACATAG